MATSFLTSPLLDRFGDAKRRLTSSCKEEVAVRGWESEAEDEDEGGDYILSPSLVPPPRYLNTPRGTVISGLVVSEIDGTKKDGHISTNYAYASILKAYLGSGLLALPFSLLCGGVVSSTVGIFVLAFVSNRTLKMLVWMRRLLQRRTNMKGSAVSYVAIGSYAYGDLGKRLAIFAELATNIGIAIGYLIFIGETCLVVVGAKEAGKDDNESHLHNTWIDPGRGIFHLNVIILACVVPLFLFSQMRSMRKMGWVSIWGTAAVVVATIVVVVSSVETIEWSHFSSFARDVDWTLRIAKMPAFFGIAMFSFTIHGVVLPVESAMSHPEDAYRVLDRCAIIVSTVYVAFGAIGYLAFQDDTQQSILDNLPKTTAMKKSIAIFVQMTLVVAMLLTVPLFNFAVLKTVEDIWFHEAIQDSWRKDIRRQRRTTNNSEDIDNNEDEDAARTVELGTDGRDSSGDLTHMRLKRQALRLSLVTFLVGASILLGPLFSQVIAFVGAFSMSAIAFILPSLFYIRICRNLRSNDDGDKSGSEDLARDPIFAPTTKNLLVAWIILLFGIATMIGATSMSIVGFVSYFSGGGSNSC